MADFLSPEWLAALERVSDRRPSAEASNNPGAEAKLGSGTDAVTVDLVVPDVAHGPVHYRFRIDVDGVHVDAHPVGTADLIVETDYATAVRLHRGEGNAQDAAASGHLKLSGRVGVLRDSRELITGLGDLFAELRASTTTPEV